MTVSLVADIGGTSTRLALARDGRLIDGSLRRLANDSVTGPEAALRAYLSDTGAAPARACLAAAGPVRDGAVRLTNRGWTISATALQTATGIAEITLMNDLQAMGHALAVPAIAGSPLSETRLVLAIGTGLNAAVAHPLPGGRAFVPPGESGYIALPFTSQDDAPLLSALADDFGAPVAEAALSGPGLERLNRLITGSAATTAEIAAQDSPARRLALRLLGRVLSSLALIHLPRGGIFLAGSVGRALFPALGSAGFTDSFLDAGAYRTLLETFNFHVIDDDAAPLHGLAFHLGRDLPSGSDAT